MALTYKQQFDIAGNKKAFEPYVIIGAVRAAKDWLRKDGNTYKEGQKIFDTTETDTTTGETKQINVEAERYRSKVHNLCVRVVNKNKDLFDAIQTMIACELADMGVTMEGLGDPNGFVATNEGALNLVIFSIFENLAGVTPKEKVKYDDLPNNL